MIDKPLNTDLKNTNTNTSIVLNEWFGSEEQVLKTCIKSEETIEPLIDKPLIDCNIRGLQSIESFVTQYIDSNFTQKPIKSSQKCDSILKSVFNCFSAKTSLYSLSKSSNIFNSFELKLVFN